MTPLDAAGAAAFEAAIRAGELAIFPADTVYGIAADPDDPDAFARLNALKRRDPAQPSGVMFFAVEHAAPLLADLGPRTRAACAALLPGPVTLVLPNPGRRHALACGATPERIGVRVPALAGPLAPLAAVTVAVVQSSANLHGGPDPRRLSDVPAELRAAAAVALDGGELPGVASTVIDLCGYEDGGGYALLREGALPAAELERALAGEAR
ncbi:MAG: threonylcarbamoyl-AMP synthase [Solirubrobacterales bacterium]|nr:threonylcarbamoyl-AMP synthase [Solirubrobacterales bacterium]